jgi:hypothetical protein
MASSGTHHLHCHSANTLHIASAGIGPSRPRLHRSQTARYMGIYTYMCMQARTPTRARACTHTHALVCEGAPTRKRDRRMHKHTISLSLSPSLSLPLSLSLSLKHERTCTENVLTCTSTTPTQRWEGDRIGRWGVTAQLHKCLDCGSGIQLILCWCLLPVPQVCCLRTPL